MITETELFESPDLNPLKSFLLVELEEEGSLQKKSG
jgi:hypothetical protein